MKSRVARGLPTGACVPTRSSFDVLLMRSQKFSGTIWKLRPPGSVIMAEVNEVKVMLIVPSLPLIVGGRYAQEMH